MQVEARYLQSAPEICPLGRVECRGYDLKVVELAGRVTVDGKAECEKLDECPLRNGSVEIVLLPPSSEESEALTDPYAFHARDPWGRPSIIKSRPSGVAINTNPELGEPYL